MNLLKRFRGTSDESPAPPVETRIQCDDPRAEQLLRQGRYCLILAEEEDNWDLEARCAATFALEREMSLVPEGSTVVQSVSLTNPGSDAHRFADCEPTYEDAFFMDRFTVTNSQYQKFVQAGGYRDESLWPEDILPLLFQFVDSTKQSGPASWKNGEPSPDLREHPVVGICWYEANAYALWAGKQLPTSAQWQRAGTWWKPHVRYPWGNSFESERIHLGSQTAPVRSYPKGNTPNGIEQLIGNVWEWVYASIEQVDDESGPSPLLEPLGEIRGGAFDTYLTSQMNCLFRSGYPLLSRPLNTGFRCSIPAHLVHLVDTDTDRPQERR